MLATKPRRITAIIVLIFVLYAIINDPDKAAEVVHRFWELVVDAVEQIFTFFDKIIGR